MTLAGKVEIRYKVRAFVTASSREWHSRACRIAPTWFLTVAFVTGSSSAIAPVVQPSSRSLSTSS